MKRLLVAIILAGLAWSTHWFWKAHQLRLQTEGWFDARRAAGWTASYDDLTILGFPNRLDATFTEFSLANPKGTARWQAPFFQIFRLSYKPDHLILVWPQAQTLTTPSGTTTITDEGLRASLILDGAMVLRSNAEARTLNIETPSGALALAGVTAAFTHVDATTYRLALNADGVAGSAPMTGQSASGLGIDATVTFDKTFTTEALTAPRPQPDRIDLRLAEYHLGALRLKLAGDLTLDDQGRASGTLSLQAANWQGALEKAGANGDLPKALITPLEQALTLAANLRGNPRTLDLSLKVTDGTLSLGPVPLGQIPPLRLP